jgi:hypothetical protein
VIALQTAHLSSRQIGRPIDIRPQISDINIPTSGRKSHKGTRYQDMLADCQSQSNFDFDFDMRRVVQRLRLTLSKGGDTYSAGNTGPVI